MSGADLGENRAVKKFNQAASQHAQIMAARVSLFNQGECIERLPREDPADDPKQSLPFDQAHAVAHGLRGDLIA